LSGDTPIAAVVAFFSDGAVHRSYPVTDDDGKLLGLLSRSDALRWKLETDVADVSLADAVSDAAQLFAFVHAPVGDIADLMIDWHGPDSHHRRGDRKGGRHPFAP
jgi:CIC family chloride channel protein